MTTESPHDFPRRRPARRSYVLIGLVAFFGRWISPAPAAEASGLTVHEWGTFTAVSGSDGVLLPGLEVEEAPLPNFVQAIDGFAPLTKGFDRPVRNVTVKMETPVLYFYSPIARPVRVEVGFNGGCISQWYPDRTSGEMLPPPANPATSTPPVDFAAGHHGSLVWQVDVLAPGAAEPITAPRNWETPQWPRARVPGANRVRGPKGIIDATAPGAATAGGPVVEGFLFYRGIGNLPLPLVTKAAGGSLGLENTGAQPIPFALVYEKRAAFPQGVVWWCGEIGAGARVMPLLRSVGDHAAAPVLAGDFPRALERAGLTPDEARAMLATWRESYCERDGLRVFWLVPRAFTDHVLPLAITPAPDHLNRVLVGRTEVLTPAFEAQLAGDFAADGGKHWATDRFFRAYQARVAALALPVP